MSEDATFGHLQARISDFYKQKDMTIISDF